MAFSFVESLDTFFCTFSPTQGRCESVKMDSPNHCTNIILPLETIESGISNSDIGNQVRQISITTDNKTDLVHYIS